MAGWHKTSRHQRGYDSRWVKLRASVLKLHNGKPTALCVHCLRLGRVTVATDCDHIIPKAKGGTDDLDNLQPLCRQCHDAKTAQDEGRKTVRAVGLDGYPI